MNSHTRAQAAAETSNSSGRAETMIGYAVYGCMIAGGVGILKSFEMKNGVDVLLCLMGSVAAFSAVFYMCFGKR